MHQTSTSIASATTLWHGQQSGVRYSCSNADPSKSPKDQDGSFLAQISGYPPTVQEAMIDLRSFGIYSVARQQLCNQDIHAAKNTIKRLIVFEWNFLSEIVHASRYMCAKQALLEIELLECTPNAASFLADPVVAKDILSKLEKPFRLGIATPPTA